MADSYVFDGYDSRPLVFSLSSFSPRHNDLPWQLHSQHRNMIQDVDLHQHQPLKHTDIPRLRAGNVWAQFWRFPF